MPLTSSQKGAVAEAEIAAALIQLGLVVLRPLCEGRRYDLVIDAEQTMLRVQCKWASRRGNIVTTRCSTSRHTPAGYRKTTYSAKEIDAVAAYAPELDRCYLLPIAEVEGHPAISLRTAPTRNQQAKRIRWACDYELSVALERYWGVTPYN